MSIFELSSKKVDLSNEKQQLLSTKLEFKLQPITETYSQLQEGKQLYFLDSENKPIKIKNITKQHYKGKIYDVDVENNIVLVRKNKRIDNLEENSIKSQNIGNKDFDKLNGNISYMGDMGEPEVSQILLENRSGEEVGGL